MPADAGLVAVAAGGLDIPVMPGYGDRIAPVRAWRAAAGNADPATMASRIARLSDTACRRLPLVVQDSIVTDRLSARTRATIWPPNCEICAGSSRHGLLAQMPAWLERAQRPQRAIAAAVLAIALEPIDAAPALWAILMAAHSPLTTVVPPVAPDQPATAWSQWLREMAQAINLIASRHNNPSEEALRLAELQHLVADLSGRGWRPWSGGDGAPAAARLRFAPLAADRSASAQGHRTHRLLRADRSVAPGFCRGGRDLAVRRPSEASRRWW